MEEKTRFCVGCFSWISMVYIIIITASPPLPSITHCELMEHANITCYWTAVGSETSSYTLWVNMTYCWHNINYKTVGWCTTADTWCSVNIGSVAHCFCADVLASSLSGSTRSPRSCFAGISQVKMYPPRFTRLAMIPGKAHCLKLEWTEDMSTPLPSERAHRVIQIEYSNPHQAHSRKESAVLHDWKMELCGLYPGTKYSVRLRAQDTRAPQHWSAWSSVREASTAESVPRASLEVWRHIQPIGDATGQRRVTLLWKPLQWPDTNGVILRYTVSCWSDVGLIGCSCDHLDASVTSCGLSISAHPCVCNLTASNSAGTSPPAHVHIPGERTTVLPPPENISITSLDDFRLKVEWTATVNQSSAIFVVEWCPIMDGIDGVYWKSLNGSARSFIITEGILPGVPYNVSVQVLHEKAAGTAVYATAFSRQGAPSVGPKLKVLQIVGSSVTLKWDAVPLEKLHGFIHNYTVLYVANGKIKSHMLGGDVEQFSLTGLSAGEYTICVKAQTVAGSAEGPWVTVTIGNDYILIVAILVCTVGGLLVIIIMLSQGERILQCFWPTIPNPSRSSLSVWPHCSRSQYKLTASDFRSHPSLFELIYLGRMATVTRDPPHEEHLQERCSSERSVPPQPLEPDHHHLGLISGTLEPERHHLGLISRTLEPDRHHLGLISRTFAAKQDTKQQLHQANSEEPEEDFTTDFSYRSDVVVKLQTLVPPASLSDSDRCLERNLADSLPDIKSLMARLRVCGQSPRSSKPWAEADDMNLSNLSETKNFTARSESSCYPNIVYSPSPAVPESWPDFRKEGLLLSPLESSCHMHISTSYLPVPDSCVAYGRCLMETEHSADTSPPSKTQSSSHIHLSATYIPVSMTTASCAREATDLESFHKKTTLSEPDCSYQPVCQFTPMYKEFEIDHMYRPLRLEECPLRLSLL